MSDPWASLLHPQGDVVNPAVPKLPAGQAEKLTVLEHTFGKEAYMLPTAEGGEGKQPLTEREIMFLSRETFIRFLLATKGDTAEAIKRLEAAVVWRRSVSIDNVEAMAEDCEPESRTGKNLVLGYSPHGQPLLYFFPNRNIVPVAERRPIHAIFMLERARDLMLDGVANVVVLFNFAGHRQGPPTSIPAARAVLHILSSHYPETLGLNIFQSLPWVVKAFINLMWPFVDPVTKAKVRFDNNHAEELIAAGELDPKWLLKESGGDLDMPYEHDKYWKALVQTCLERRKRQEAWFRKGERRVGRSEREWKRSDAPWSDAGKAAPVSGTLDTAAPTAQVVA